MYAFIFCLNFISFENSNRYYGASPISSRIPFTEVVTNCILPSGVQTVEKILPLFIACFAFYLLCQLVNRGMETCQDDEWNCAWIDWLEIFAWFSVLDLQKKKKIPSRSNSEWKEKGENDKRKRELIFGFYS